MRNSAPTSSSFRLHRRYGLAHHGHREPTTGWTGYTWNRALFPDPKASSTAARPGPAHRPEPAPCRGIHPHEAQYPELAGSMGIDPARPADRLRHRRPAFMKGYFELLHHPYEDQGVDFWWLDWQQGTQTRLPGLDPLWWLNHLHFTTGAGMAQAAVHLLALGRPGQPSLPDRVLRRYGRGLGGAGLSAVFHRDRRQVGYGWWSHDIGGHMRGIEDQELYTRWVQFGAFSPILRLHSTNNPYHERRPWARGQPSDAGQPCACATP